MIVQALVANSAPWTQWGPSLIKELKWPEDLYIERHDLSESSWVKVVDSYRSFTLFQKRKLLLISQVEKKIPDAEEWNRLLKIFGEGSHYVVLTVSQILPFLQKNSKVSLWKSPDAEEPQQDKSVFQWIDALHNSQAARALDALDQAIQNGLHPMAAFQILNKDLRLGRLIHYARDCKLSDAEISQTLKAHPFVVQKWLKRKTVPNAQWARIFDRLLAADLEMKSSNDAAWALRRLSLDLNQLLQKKLPQTLKPQKTASEMITPSFWQPTPQLWRASPSFA